MYTGYADFVTEIVVTDPDSKLPVHVSLFKERESGGIFGVDSSYIEQVIDAEEDAIPSVFANGYIYLVGA